MPKNPVVPVRNFVAKHRVAIAITATFVLTASLNRKAIQQHNDFLKEHNLFEAFYLPED